MSRPLSATAFRSLFAQETDEVLLVCLTLTHASLAVPIRVVHNNEKILRASGEYLPVFFDISLPEEVEDQVPTVALTIDNVDRGIIDSIRTLTGRVKVAMEVVLASTPDTVEAGPFNFDLLSITYDALKIQGNLSFEDDILNVEFPKDKYTPLTAKGLFA